MNSITYPTGAYVAYTWEDNPDSEYIQLSGNGGGGTPACYYQHSWPAIHTRIVSFDGVHQNLEQDFSYSTTWGSNGLWTNKSTTVVTKDCTRASSCSAAPSFETQYTYLSETAAFGGAGQGQTPIENTIVYKDWNGAILKTVTKN